MEVRNVAIVCGTAGFCIGAQLMTIVTIIMMCHR